MARRRDEPTLFDLWVKSALKERYGPVTREALPDALVALLDETPTAH